MPSHYKKYHLQPRDFHVAKKSQLRRKNHVATCFINKIKKFDCCLTFFIKKNMLRRGIHVATKNTIKNN